MDQRSGILLLCDSCLVPAKSRCRPQSQDYRHRARSLRHDGNRQPGFASRSPSLARVGDTRLVPLRADADVLYSGRTLCHRSQRGVPGTAGELDWRIVAPALEWCKRSPVGPWILMVLELAYLLCYVSMPLGLAVLYLLRLRHLADWFWTVVLPATYACYAMLPFIQTQPPRVLPETRSVQPPPGKVRAFNLWILRHASIHANTFPSAHVASTDRMCPRRAVAGAGNRMGVSRHRDPDWNGHSFGSLSLRGRCRPGGSRGTDCFRHPDHTVQSPIM